MYRQPQLNLDCRIWRNWDTTHPPPTTAADAHLACALRNGWRQLLIGTYLTGIFHYSVLVLEARADVRGPHPGFLGDLCEVPAHTGRFYSIQAVDDVARGFANEYRIAALESLQSVVGYWVYPIP